MSDEHLGGRDLGSPERRAHCTVLEPCLAANPIDPDDGAVGPPIALWHSAVTCEGHVWRGRAEQHDDVVVLCVPQVRAVDDLLLLVVLAGCRVALVHDQDEERYAVLLCRLHQLVDEVDLRAVDLRRFVGTRY